MEANPGDRTGGEKDKEAAHRTPAQPKKRNGPGGTGMGQGAMMLPEQGAQAAGENSGGDLRGGDATGIEGEQHGLSNAPHGRKEGGVEPRSPVLGSEKQSELQEGVAVAAIPVGQTGTRASKSLKQKGTHPGVGMPVGTANEQPKLALTRALGAMGRALPEAVQTIVQTRQSAAHADTSGTGASIAPEKKDTPLGGMMSEGTASLQPQQALTRALG